MKKVLSTILALVITLSIFTACGTEVDKVENTTVTQYTTKGKTNELVPDETATGTLVVSEYLYDLESSYYIYSLDMYKELYPNVEIELDLTTYAEMEWNSYFDKIATEVMSGNGPDIFKVGGEQDVYKMMKSGVFADLTPYFENDMAFDVSKYNEAVLYGGQFEGKQYIVPMEYSFKTFFSTKEVIDEIGFDIEKCTNYYNTMEEIYRVSKENVLDTSKQICHPPNLGYSLFHAGLNTFDYSNNKVDFNNDIIKGNIEITKDVYDLMETYIPYNNDSLIFGKDCLFDHQYAVQVATILELNREVCTKDEVVLIPSRNSSGGITAESSTLFGVNANSDNVQNAYNFLKLQVHPELQNRASHKPSSPVSFIPLSYEAVQTVLDAASKGFVDPDTGVEYKGRGSNENTDKLEKDFFDLLREIDGLDMMYMPKSILFDEMIIPYFNDEITLDEGLQNAQDKLELYISE